MIQSQKLRDTHSLFASNGGVRNSIHIIFHEQTTFGAY